MHDVPGITDGITIRADRSSITRFRISAVRTNKATMRVAKRGRKKEKKKKKERKKERKKK
jgi:hypothetical protein